VVDTTAHPCAVQGCVRRSHYVLRRGFGVVDATAHPVLYSGIFHDTGNL